MGTALGQHFLVDAAAIGRLVAAAGLLPGARVLDAGAGHGAVTAALAAAVGANGRVTAVEIDPSLLESLRASGMPSVDVVAGDVLHVAWPPGLDALVANPPFKVLPPLLLRAWREAVKTVVVLVPREFSQRATAPVGGDHYGRLTMELRIRFTVERLFDLPPRVFDPPPDTPVSALRLRARPLPAGVEEGSLAALLDGAWESKRRTLRRGLAPVATRLRVSSGHVSQVLEQTGTGALTAVEVSPERFADLARRILAP